MLAKTRPLIIASLCLLFISTLRAAEKTDRKTKLEALSLTYEALNDRLRFHFHNPVMFGGALVPHQYVQTYTADNHWGILRGYYTLWGVPMESEFGMTPQRTNYGDDYDTTFEPSGNVNVSGTFGNVSMKSLKFRQRMAIAKAKGISFSLAYEYRQNRSNFQYGNSFETNTNPPSAIFEKLPIQETTKSRLHSFDAGARRCWRISPHWTIVTEANFSPSTLAFLSTFLPLKYPGEEIVSLAKGFGISPRLGLCFARGVTFLEIHGEYGRTWSYSSANDFRREFFGTGISLGLRRHP